MGIDMANTSPNARGPIAPPAHVGSMGIRVGSVDIHVGSTRLFRYQHDGIGNTKVLHLGDYPTQGLNASGFALWWNVGFSI